MEKLVSTKIFERTLQELQTLKVHPRQPNSEVIAKAVTTFKSLKTSWEEMRSQIPPGDYPEGFREMAEKLLG